MTARILIVDDYENNLDVLEAKLAAEYYTVYRAQNGAQAIEIACEIIPDIILLDVMMPKISGLEVCEVLKNDYRTFHIPIIILTALNDATNKIKALRAGADDFLTKPIDNTALFCRLRASIRLKIMYDELSMHTESKFLKEYILNNIFDIHQIDYNIAIVDDIEFRPKNIEKIIHKEFPNIKCNFFLSKEYDLNSLLEEFHNSDKEYFAIFINVQIEQFNALKLVGALRAAKVTRDTNVFALIDEEDQSLLGRIFEMGISDYLTLPYDQNELLARFITLLKRYHYKILLKDNYLENIKSANIDQLTQSYNRHYMNHYITNLEENRTKLTFPIFVAMLDVDFFKRINDTYGHHAGDLLLKEFARLVQENTREADVLFRYGGEEFLLIIKGCHAREYILMLTNRLCEKIANHDFIIDDGTVIKCTVSIGVATYTEDITIQECINHADKSLYTAKKSGRNRVVLYNSDPLEEIE